MERFEIPLIGLTTCISIAIYDPIIKMERFYTNVAMLNLSVESQPSPSEKLDRKWQYRYM
jgi:hypothetical protein